MARATEKNGRIETFPLGDANEKESVDLVIKSLIDELIVPYLVEEFLRLHGPAAVAKLNGRNPESMPDSELNSTP